MRRLLSIALALLAASIGYAQSFTYQGLLKDGGTPANGAYDFRFRLWTAASGGTQVGSDQFVNDLTVQNGLFTTELDFGNVWDGSDRYLEIAVRPGSSTGAYTTLSPRVKITRAPYAARADAAPPIGAAGGDLSGTYPNPTVAGLQGRAVSSTAPSTGQVLKWDGSAWSPSDDLRDAFWQASGNNIFYNAGNVGIGTGSPLYRLHVETSAGDRAIYGLHTASSGVNYGVYGRSNSPDGTGVYGLATATSGETYGVYGQSNSPDGTGVFGYATATSGYTNGVYGQSDSTFGTGVFGWATATSGRGVFGVATAPSGETYGGRFRSYSTSGRGVFGYASATSGETYGGRFESASTDGRGVYGAATATSGGAWGVWGGTSSFASTAYGVLGSEPSGGAGHAVFASGSLAAGGTKSFQIDHPLRPETHYLNHFCTEGPEPYNAYSGNVVTDAQGYATVTLPPYFESINRDFRYQLTVIDDSDDFVLAKVVREIQNNRFVIRTSKPHVKVSWRVEAVRNDRWVQQYGYQTEQEKEDEIKGKYLHPELYGQPKEQGIHHRPEPERPHEAERPK